MRMLVQLHYDPTEGNISSRLTSTSDVDDQAAGIYYVTYCVSDASGNAAPCVTRVVYVVVDQSAPELTLTGADTVYVDVITGTYNEPGFKAIDKTDGDLTTAVQVTGTVNIIQNWNIHTYLYSSRCTSKHRFCNAYCNCS